MTNKTRKINVTPGKQGFQETEKAEAAPVSLTPSPEYLENPECLIVNEGSIVEWSDPETGDTEIASVYSVASSAHPLDFVKAPAGDDELLLYLTDGEEVLASRREVYPVRERLQPGDFNRDPFNLGVPTLPGGDLDRSVYEFNNAKTAIVKKGDGLNGPYDVTLISSDKNGKSVFEDHKAQTPADVAELLRHESIPDDNMRAVFTAAVNMSAEQRVRLTRLHDDLNEGAWGDIEAAAHIAVAQAEIPMSDEHTHAADAIADFSAPSAFDLVKRSPGLSRTDYVAASAVREAAWALARRDLVGDDRVTRRSEHSGHVSGWTQEAYDHITRPYRLVVGPLHPDDESLPASWAKRPSPQPEFDGMFGVAREDGE
jgi:hypothetical protein